MTSLVIVACLALQTSGIVIENVHQVGSVPFTWFWHAWVGVCCVLPAGHEAVRGFIVEYKAQRSRQAA